MKIHPCASKRSITMRDAYVSPMNENPYKKLRKLPHVFSKVLELPFSSDSDVSVEDSQDIIRFVAKIDVQGEHVANVVRAHAVEIHPGVTKIVVRSGGGDSESELLLDQLKVDAWRFRLPRSARPESATAVFVDGELVVTVPKGGQREVEDGRNVWGGDGQLVLVQ